MAQFNVTVSEVTNAATKIASAANDFLTTAGKVMQAAEALGSSWEGDSQVAFMQEQQNAHSWYEKMAEIVTTYVESLNQAAKKYQDADDQAKAAIGSK
jgi:WXG100 family type VII secretion target